MQISIRSRWTVTAISLFLLLGSGTQSGAQTPIFNRTGDLPKLWEKEGNTRKAETTYPAPDYSQQVLWSFCSAANCTDGASPRGGLIQDTAGNLYGTTDGGGASGNGTVFMLDSTGKETVLYSFCFATNCTDGSSPGAGLIQDAAGNLYGTTANGGANFGALRGDGGGTVFKLDSSGTGTLLYSFCSAANCTDGASPIGSLIQDASGNLYGTTPAYGAHGWGTVFKVDTTGHETVVYSFCSAANCADGASPSGGLIQDAAGNLYGTTNGGGTSVGQFGGVGGGGTVFKVDPTGTETVLYSFCSAANCTDGAGPTAGLIQDAAGILYGTTDGGGVGGGGTVFKVDPTDTETVLYSFCSAANCTDGSSPIAGLIQDGAGNLYGTTEFGGANNSGTVFKVDTTGHEAVLYSFCSAANCADGSRPFTGDLIQDAVGNLYGTTVDGGVNANTHGTTDGTVFKLVSGTSLQTPTVMVTPSSPSITTVQALTVTVAVSGGTGNPTPTGTVTLSSAGSTLGVATLNGGSASINIAAGSLPVGTDTLTGSYSGDSNYNAATGTSSVTVTVLGTPGFTVGGTAVTVSRGATTGNTSTITVTPSGDFTGTIALTAAISSSPAGGNDLPTFSFGSTSPVTITGPAAGTAMLTIYSTAATSHALAHLGRPTSYWYTASSLGLAFVLMFLPGIPARGGTWRARIGLLVLLVAIAGGSISCGGGPDSSKSSGGGGSGDPGTTAGSYTVTVTGTSGGTTATGTVNITVN